MRVEVLWIKEVFDDLSVSHYPLIIINQNRQQLCGSLRAEKSIGLSSHTSEMGLKIDCFVIGIIDSDKVRKLM